MKKTERRQDMRFQVRQDSLTLTSQGYWIVEIAASRTGIQTYLDETMPGGKRVEFRSFEEVTAEPSLASWEHAPLAIFHPKEGEIKLDNSPRLKRGYAFGKPRVEHNQEDGEDYVVVSALVDHPELVDGIRSGRLVEVSAGYDCLFDPTPGEYKGQKYDGRQVDIRINHLSFLPPGFARAGKFARVRLDGDRAYFDIFFEKEPTMGNLSPTTKVLQRVRLDATAFIELEPTQAAQVESALQVRDSKITTLEADNQKLQGEKSTLDGQVTGLNQRVTQLASDLENARKDQVDVAEWLKTYERAKPHLDAKDKLDDFKTLRDLKLAVLKKLDSAKDFSTVDDKFIDGFFMGVTTAPDKPPVGSGQPSDQIRGLLDSLQTAVINPDDGGREDAGEPEESGYSELCKYLENAHQKGAVK